MNLKVEPFLEGFLVTYRQDIKLNWRILQRASKEVTWALRLWEIFRIVWTHCRNTLVQKYHPLQPKMCQTHISSYCLIQDSPQRSVILTTGTPAPEWRCWKLCGPSAGVSLLVDSSRVPFGGRCQQLQREIGIAAHLRWRWQKKWQEHQSQWAEMPCPGSLSFGTSFKIRKLLLPQIILRLKSEREGRGGYFILWKLLF